MKTKKCFEFRIDYKNKGAVGSHGGLSYCLNEIGDYCALSNDIEKITIKPHEDCWRNEV